MTFRLFAGVIFFFMVLLVFGVLLRNLPTFLFHTSLQRTFPIPDVGRAMPSCNA